MKKTRNLPENFRITNHKRIEGGGKSTKWFWLNLRYVLGNLGCPDIPSKMRTKTELVSKDVESISWDDKTYLKSICWLESPVCRFHGLQPEKKKKWIKFWIRWIEESWENLVKGTQVPVARAIIIHEIKAMNSRFTSHTSQRLYSVYNVYNVYKCCTSCTFLCYSGRIWDWLHQYCSIITTS